MEPKEKGEVVEALILAAFVAAGVPVLVPWGDNKRYDLVVDLNGGFKRVQCKTGTLKNGAVGFRTASSKGRWARTQRGYVGQIDYFAVHCFENGKNYLVPIEDVGASAFFTLRETKSKNAQTKGINLATKYEFALVAQ